MVGVKYAILDIVVASCTIIWNSYPHICIKIPIEYLLRKCLCCVYIASRTNKSLSTQSNKAKCLMSMCLVWHVGCWAIAISNAPALSSISAVVSCCSMPTSCSNDQRTHFCFLDAAKLLLLLLKLKCLYTTWNPKAVQQLHWYIFQLNMVYMDVVPISCLV